MRTIHILVATLIMGLCHNVSAVTVVVDAAWVRAGLGSAADRCLDDILLGLKPGDTLEMIMPTLGESAASRPLLGFTSHRRPSVRAAQLTATRRQLNRVLATVDPTGWPSLAQILMHVAATANRNKRLERRYVVVGALTAGDPPAVDLDLQRLFRGRQVTVMDLAHPPPKRHDSRLKAWRRFFAAAGAAQLDIRALAAPSEPRTVRPRKQAIDCSRRRLQILDH